MYTLQSLELFGLLWSFYIVYQVLHNSLCFSMLIWKMFNYALIILGCLTMHKWYHHQPHLFPPFPLTSLLPPFQLNLLRKPLGLSTLMATCSSPCVKAKMRATKPLKQNLFRLIRKSSIQIQQQLFSPMDSLIDLWNAFQAHIDSWTIGCN